MTKNRLQGWRDLALDDPMVLSSGLLKTVCFERLSYY